MELVAAGWCIRKRLGFYQTVRNFTFDGLGIPLVVIKLGVTRLKKKMGRMGSMFLVPYELVLF